MNICLLVFLGGLTNDLFAQSDSTILHPKFSISVPDSGTFLTDSAALVEKNLSTIGDSLVSAADSVLRDSVAKDSSARKSDSLAAASGVIPLSPSALTSVVHYTAEDSIAIDLGTRKAQLYNKGVIDYDGMQLKADDIRVDFDQQMLTAQLVLDTSGQPLGRPYFKEKDAEYMADTIFFNYRTKKGLISGVITKQGDGFLHGSRVKKMNDSVMYLNGGQYTTCNYSHPHFAINFSHSKLITHDKIFTGPAYVTIEDVPTPLVLPFAFFPMKKEQTSGIIMPSYGWMNNRGYYLKDGGYYFDINDYIDLALTGELYTNLSWAAEAKSNYYVRYKYKGNLDLRYGITKEGIPGDTNSFQKFSDFKLVWKHDQDAKANPRSRFSADVNLQSRNYSKNTTNRDDYFNSTTTSSISYTAQLGRSFNLAASLRESYNVQTGLMNLKLPSISLSSTTFYPLRRKDVSGSYRWYENISMSYSLSADNNISAQDSDLLKLSIFNKMQYGVQHAVPISFSRRCSNSSTGPTLSAITSVGIGPPSASRSTPSTTPPLSTPSAASVPTATSATLRRSPPASTACSTSAKDSCERYDTSSTHRSHSTTVPTLAIQNLAIGKNTPTTQATYTATPSLSKACTEGRRTGARGRCDSA